MRGEWPLTGREVELAVLLRYLREARGVVVSGPAGVGKTRLAREAAARAGGPVRWAVASASARSIPFGAFTALTTALVPGTADAVLMARLADALRATGSVLGIDDAHSLDPASADLVHQLATEHAVRLVVTVRDGEKMPEAIAALRTDGILPGVALEPLDRGQTAAVLAAALGGPVEGITVDRLHDTTGGNALWLTMLVQGERAAGRMICSRGTWMWDGDLRLSPALDELVAAGVDQLDGPAREALELLALGEPLSSAVVTALVDHTAVETLLDGRLARVEESADRLRLAHPLFGEAVRARISTLRARRLRGALYDALAGSPDTLRRAVLLLDSDRPHQPELLLAAAVAAVAFVDVAAAIRLSGAARDAGGGFEAQLMHAFLLAWGWTEDPAIPREFRAAVELADSDDDLIRAGLGITFGALFEGKNTDHQVQRAEIVGRLADPTRAAEVDGAAAVYAVLCDDLAAGRTMIEPILRSPDAGPAAQAFAGWAAAALAAVHGWQEDDTQRARRSYAACVRQPETAGLWLNIAFWEMLGLALTGRVDEAAGVVEPFAETPPAMRFMTDAITAVGDIAAGRVVTASRRLRDALLRAPGDFGGWTKGWGTLGCLASAMAGDATAAAESFRAGQRFRRDRPTVDDPLGELAQAWLAAAEGAVSEGLALARAAAAGAAASQQWAVELVARLAAVRFGDGTQAGRLAELADAGSGPLPASAAAHARAVADRDADALAAVADRYEDAGLLLLAADAAAQAADLYRTAGAAGPGAAAASRASDLARRCEGARTPALVVVLHPLPISAREREIATLARAGLTNRQIGERLHLSTRTVEGHVYHACAKLEVVGRSDLIERVAGR